MFVEDWVLFDLATTVGVLVVAVVAAVVVVEVVWLEGVVLGGDSLERLFFVDVVAVVRDAWKVDSK